MEKNKDFNEDEQPQEEFTDPLPGEGEAEPNKDIFGFPEIPAEDTAEDEQEREIQYEQTVAELRRQDALDAAAFRKTLQKLRKRKRIADLGGSPNFANLETYVTSVEQQRKISQKRVLQPEMQAEIEKRSLENGLQGRINKLRKRFGWKIKTPKNLDMNDVYNTVVDRLEEKRRTHLVRLQEREETHAEQLSGEDSYLAKMQEYQSLVRDALAAIEVAQAREKTLEDNLTALRAERNRLAKKVAAKPHHADVQKEYQDTLRSIKSYEQELHGITCDLQDTYDDMADNDAKFDHYASLVNQERALHTITRKSARNAQRDVDDLGMYKESESAIGGTGDTVREIVGSEAERGKVDSFLKPQGKASKKLLSKVMDYMDAGDSKRRSLASSAAVEDINFEQDLERRDMYTKMRIKYG